MSKYVTSMSTITLVVIKHLRKEANHSQEWVADKLVRSKSDWTKIENLQSALTLDVMFKLCEAFKVYPSDLMKVVDDYIDYLVENGWDVTTGMIDPKDDSLLLASKDFYTSESYTQKGSTLKRRCERFSIMETEITRRHKGKIFPLLEYAASEDYKNKVLNNPSYFSLDGINDMIDEIHKTFSCPKN